MEISAVSLLLRDNDPCSDFLPQLSLDQSEVVLKICSAVLIMDDSMPSLRPGFYSIS